MTYVPYLLTRTRNRDTIDYHGHRYTKVYETTNTEAAHRRAVREDKSGHPALWTGQRIEGGRLYGVYTRGDPPKRSGGGDASVVPFTTRKGRVRHTSERQHRWMHARLNEGDDRGDHTHVHPDGRRTRETSRGRSAYRVRVRR